MSIDVVNKTKHPKMFWLSGIVMLAERFGYYILSFVLVLYMQACYKLPDKEAFAMYAVFAALSYLTPLIGGYLSDNYIGTERVLITGLFIEATGYLLLSFKGTISFFYLALAFVIVGAGLFKTAPTNLMGKSYNGADDPRLDSAFTYFYMFINIGMIAASYLTSALTGSIGFNICFLIGSIICYIGVFVYCILKKKVVKKEYKTEIGQNTLPLKNWLLFTIGVVLFILIFSYMISNKVVYDVFFCVTLALFVVYFVYEMFVLDKVSKEKLIAAMILILFGTAFFMLYNQLYSSMVLFFDRCVDRRFLGYTFSPIMLQSVNPLTIIILGPILALFYSYLNRKGKDIHITIKFPLGLYCISLCFFVLVLSIYLADNSAKINPVLPILSVVFYTIGELLISALGMSMVTKMAPKKLFGLMMGAWYFIGTSLGALLSGWLANLAVVPSGVAKMQEVHIYFKAFLIMGIIGAIISTVALLLSPFVKKMSNS